MQPIVRVLIFFFFIKQIMILRILNLAGYQNCMIGSTITTILMMYEKTFYTPCVSWVTCQMSSDRCQKFLNNFVTKDHPVQIFFCKQKSFWTKCILLKVSTKKVSPKILLLPKCVGNIFLSYIMLFTKPILPYLFC